MIAEAETTTRHAQETRKLDIEFLFLDLNTCTRCVGTNENLERALKSVQQVLDLTSIELETHKILVDSPEKAQAYRFSLSPTIRVNGNDIALETKENRCDSCTDLCGCEEGTNCRIWVYRGQEYTEAPVGMIVEALLQEAFNSNPQAGSVNSVSNEVPENLKQFFAVKAQYEETDSPTSESACCSAEEQQDCCDPPEKVSCCGTTSEPDSCGANRN